MKYFSFLFLFLLLGLGVPAIAGDKDRDGIPNKYDECKNEPEDKDGFEDTDGCPDPDNDKDGVLDINDKCLNVPEDIDGFEDNDGCPDPDNDKDGVPDTKDKCPNQPEDFDTFEDMDGCPDPDNDKDGIPDLQDKCPADPEDMDGFEDQDGCPDYDNDQDGIKDAADKCPNDQETINGKDDEDGCPDTGVPLLQEVQILPFVDFRTGTDELIFESFRSLDSLALQLATYTNKKVKLFLFRPFTINTDTSLALLRKQHDAVVNYLISKGAAETQFATTDYSLEAYEQVKETDQDFNQEKPMEVRLVQPGSEPPTAPPDTSKEEE